MGNMKDSGVEWIGMIPEEWNKNKVRYIFSIMGGNGFPIELQGKDDGKYPFCKCSDINGKQMYVDTAANCVDEQDIKENKFNIIPVNSLIFAKIGEALKKNHRKLNAVECCIDNNTQALAVINKDYDYRYAYYVFTNIDMYEFDNGGPVPSVNNNKLKDLYIPKPMLSEQQLIANFLDDKVGKIDDILSDLRKQVETLQKYKKSVITKAVTKGLNPDVAMKDSGIDWIGAISKEAKIIKLKYFSYMKGRIGWQGLKSEDFIEEGPYCVTGTDFHNGKIDWSTCYHVSEERYNMDTNIHIKIGDLLVTKDGTIGKLARVEELPDKACLNSHLLIIRPLKDMFTNSFLYYVMSSSVFTEYYSLVSTGTTMDSLSQEKMGEFIFPVFEIAEQERIADYLDDKCAKIDELIKDKEAQIEKMEKYKKSLIYEYVTGKKRVKGAV